jgi:glyoxylase-like metal-dependent hydrolase (beta-lactamase superfamily II)
VVRVGRIFKVKSSFFDVDECGRAAQIRRMKFPGLAAIGCVAIFSMVARAEPNKVEKLADDVYFHEGDIEHSGHCNNGWIVFKDYVLVIDANFPSGADVVIPKIREITDKPIKFVFDTHHHGDHAYGNQTFANAGAVPVAHEGVLESFKKFEPQRWDDMAKNRKDVAASKLKAPTLLFRRDMIFDDGEHRVELLHFGVAHTHGDGFAWLPKEKILFTGDACVNGPYNFTGDGDIGQWINTLAAAQKLGAEKICPGHGPRGEADVIENQRNFFIALRDGVKAWKDSGKTAEQAKEGVGALKESIAKNEKLARYVGGSFNAQAEQAWKELGGEPFPK